MLLLVPDPEGIGDVRTIGDGWMVGPGDPVGLFQPRWFCDHDLPFGMLKGNVLPWW